MKRPFGQRTFQLLLLTAIVVVINMLSTGFFYRLDLTAEKRYTLSHLSIETMKGLDADLTVKVYLDGSFQPRIKRFADAITTTLIELKVHAGQRLNYQFIDPSDNPDLQRYLAQKGVKPLEIKFKGEKGEVSRKWIFPAAILTYRGSEEVVNLLENNCVFSARGQVCDYTKAEDELEYKLVSHIRRMRYGQKRVVGLLRGHGETDRRFMQEFISEMEKFYTVMDIDVRKGEDIPPSIRLYPDSIKSKIKGTGEGVEVLIVAQPDSLLSKREKYAIDQYIMLGGRVLWLVDKTYVDERDFNLESNSTLTEERKLNLDDLFNRYGFRITSTTLQDDIAGSLPIKVELEGKFTIVPRKWVYYPMIVDFPVHPANRNMNFVMLRYASTIDTLPTPGLTFRPMLRSSPFSRTMNTPTLIPFEITIAQPPPRTVYKGKGNQLVGLSIEGTFQSAFIGQQVPTDTAAPERPKAKYLPQSAFPTKMVVIADGDIVLPDFTNRRPGIEPDMPSGNKLLLMNCIEYLMDENALTDIRSKQTMIRSLATKRVFGNQVWIQAMNIAVPVLVVLLLGMVQYVMRRRKHLRLKV